jgi:hypothetical protein
MGRIRLLLAKELERPAEKLLLMFVGKRLGDTLVFDNLGLRKNEVLQVMLLD